MRRVDLRSDVVTLPTDEMRRAMAAAEVGDDGRREDPTVNRLEELAAAKVGKEAALFLPTGTMANKAAALAHTKRGDEVILEASSSMFMAEAGGLATLLGLQTRTIVGRKGVMDPDEVRRAIRPENINYPTTGLVAIENTHTRAGHVCVPLPVMRALARVAHNAGVPVHVDGARIFNASVALGLPASELAADADSVMFALSKGLGAPVGSMLAGNKDFIARARRGRKVLGGSMRQAGVIAAAGIIALEQQTIDRLVEDHVNARRLAEGLAEIPGAVIDFETVQTNCVMVNTAATGISTERLVADLAAEGVLCEIKGFDTIRCVTHKDVGREDIDYALAVMLRVCRTSRTR